MTFFSYWDIDIAHTKESAKALMNTIKMAYLEAPLGLIVAMASDKDHVGLKKIFFKQQSL